MAAKASKIPDSVLKDVYSQIIGYSNPFVLNKCFILMPFNETELLGEKRTKIGKKKWITTLLPADHLRAPGCNAARCAKIKENIRPIKQILYNTGSQIVF